MKTGVRTITAILGTVAFIASCGRSTEQEQETGTSTPPAVVTPVVASVVAAPIPVPATDGKDHLAYELQLTNTLTQEVTLTSLAVVAGDQTLMTLSGDNLAYWTRIIGNTSPTTKLGPGQTALVWLDVVVDEPATVPEKLTHAIGISVPKPQPPLLPATMTETVGQVSVQTRKPVVIAPPLDGPNWLDGDSCCDMTAHRMAMNPLNGQLWASERFAIDYIQLGPGGRMFAGDKTKPESYPYFGADIHAVADGKVVSVLDGLPEQVAGKSPTGLPLDQYGGNHIVQDIGDGNYAFYAHLKTGSVKVKPGRRADHRPGHRVAGQHRQFRRTAPAFPRHEHTRSAGFRRPAVRVLLVQAELADGVPGRNGRTAKRAPRAAAARLRRPRRNRCQPTGSRRDDLCHRIVACAPDRSRLRLSPTPSASWCSARSAGAATLRAVSAAGIAETAWPFLAGAGVGWLVSRGWRRPTALAPTGVVVWVCTVAVGMLLRRASSQGVAVSFVVVASLATAVVLLGWRAVAGFATRR